MREFLEYLFVKSLLGAAAILPESAIFAVSQFLAKTLFRIDKKRRSIAIDNLMRALHISEDEARALALQNYIELSKTVAEILFLYHNRFSFEAVDTSELEKLQSLQSPIIFITAHIGNWEALAQLLAQKGYPMGVVGREGNNKLIEERITRPFRERFGNSLIYKHKAARELVKYLRNGQNVGLLLDQRAGQQGIWVEFFSRKASTVPTAYILQKRFQTPIVPVFLVRENDRLKLKVFDPMEFIDDEATHTRRINEVYEKIIRTYPTQWFWMHDRWRG